MTEGSKQGNLSAVAEDKLDKLLEAYGIAREFIQFSGEVARIPLANRLRILAALGVEPADEAEVDRLLEEQEGRDWARWTQPVVLVDASHPRLPLVLPLGRDDSPLRWRVDLEEGGTSEGEFVPASHPIVEEHRLGGQAYARRLIPLPALPLGYHRLRLDDGGGGRECALIVNPPRCHEPDWLREERRLWGLAVQLYSLRSGSDWGIGDFRDLRRVVELGAERGADFVLLNPFHALDNRYPENASPYSPIDRRFLNPLYIHVDEEEDFLSSPEAAQWRGGEEFRTVVGSLRGLPDVDYPGVFRLKYRAFGLMYERFKSRVLAEGGARAESYGRFVEEGGELLRDFSRFQAEAGVEGLDSGGDPGFHAYLQWLAQAQLGACQALAQARGMRLGLIRDLAIGGGADSCEVKSAPELFCLEARIGAPPDNFNPDGQNWGLPPIRPDVMEGTRFAHWIALLRRNMKDCGALRIDHVIGLMRLWWCPTDGTNAAGAYVHYPVQELFAILRLESARARCVVIGEDLGVVPPEIRRYIDESGVLSNVIFYFEKYDGWHFKKPAHYPRRALAIVANHDVPTLRGWWDMGDLELRRRLGLIPNDEQLARDRESRRNEKAQVLEWLAAEQLLPPPWWDRNTDKPFDTVLAASILRCCARAASLLVSVQLDDIACMDKPVNIPGIGSEYPNWRRKLDVPLEELFAREETARLLAGLQQERS